MQIRGTYLFDAPRDLVWEMLLDPEVLAKIMPDCRDLRKTAEDEYRGRMNIKIGPVQGIFQGTVKLSDIRQLEGYGMQISARGPAGVVDGSGFVSLESNGTTTIMEYSGDASVGGRIASVGQRVMDTSARAITKQSLENLDRQVQARLQHISKGRSATAVVAPETVEHGASQDKQVHAAADDHAVLQEVPAASRADFATRIARDLFGEFVPEDKQPWIAAGLLTLLVYLVLNWWTNVIASRVVRRLDQARISRR